MTNVTSAIEAMDCIRVHGSPSGDPNKLLLVTVQQDGHSDWSWAGAGYRARSRIKDAETLGVRVIWEDPI